MSAAYDAIETQAGKATEQIRLVFLNPEHALQFTAELLAAVSRAQRNGGGEVCSPVHFCTLERTE